MTCDDRVSIRAVFLTRRGFQHRHRFGGGRLASFEHLRVHLHELQELRPRDLPAVDGLRLDGGVEHIPHILVQQGFEGDVNLVQVAIIGLLRYRGTFT